MNFEHEKHDYLKIVLQIKFGKIRPGQIIAGKYHHKKPRPINNQLSLQKVVSFKMWLGTIQKLRSISIKE